MTVPVNETVRNLADSVRRYVSESASQLRDTYRFQPTNQPGQPGKTGKPGKTPKHSKPGKHSKPAWSRWESSTAAVTRWFEELRSQARRVGTPAQKTAALGTGASLLLAGMVFGVAEAAPRTLAEREMVSSQPLAASLVEKLPVEEGAPSDQPADPAAAGSTAPVVEEPPSVPLDELHINGPFGWRINPMTGSGQEFHTGTDLRGTTGTPVKSAAAGTVTEAGWHTNGGGGLRIVVDHGGGVQTTYNHLSEIWVEPGQQVDIAQGIGAVGSTGNSTGPHLHFEMLINGEYVDPMEHI